MAATDRMIPSLGSQVFSRTDGDNFACFLDFSSDAWCFRDLKGHFTYVNSSFLTMVGAQAASQLLNKPLSIIEAFASEHIDNLSKIERQVIAMEKPVIIPIWGVNYPGFSNAVVNININPLFSLENNAVLGAYWSCYPQRFVSLRQLFDGVGIFDNHHKSISPYDFLSKKEWLVAWLYSQGWSHKLISKKHAIAEARSRKIISRCYKKLQVMNQQELIDMVIFNGWDSEIPVFLGS